MELVKHQGLRSVRVSRSITLGTGHCPRPAYAPRSGLDMAPPPVPLNVPEGGRTMLHRLAALFSVATFPLLDRAFDIEPLHVRLSDLPGVVGVRRGRRGAPADP